MPHAKRSASDGDTIRTRAILTEAFRAYSFITMFGSAFIFCFAPDVVRLLFGQLYEQAAETLVPFFTMATALYVFRAYYFGQAIYFLENASIELYASIATVVAGVATAALLIPSYGSTGAAMGFFAAQAAGCLVAALAARKWRAMPLPIIDLFGIAIIAAAAAFMADAAALLPISHATLLVLRFAALCAAAGLTIKLYDIFGLGVWAQKLSFRRLCGFEAAD
jgi:O-antigen/teichoic acid export membrane protein